MQEVVAFCAGLHSSVRGALKYDETAVLLHLRAKGASTPGEIARALGLSPSKVSRCLAKVEEMSLAEGIPDADDLRKCTFRLTNRGENAAFEYIRVHGQKPAREMLDRYAAVQLAEPAARALLGGEPLSRSTVLVLLALGAAGEPLSVSELQRVTGLAQSRLSMALDSMEKRWLVTSRTDSKDARRHLYSLSATSVEAARILLGAFRPMAETL